MRRMHWSWEQLQATPMYVRNYCLRILNMIGEHEKQEAERQRTRADRSRG